MLIPKAVNVLNAPATKSTKSRDDRSSASDIFWCRECGTRSRTTSDPCREACHMLSDVPFRVVDQNNIYPDTTTTSVSAAHAAAITESVSGFLFAPGSVMSIRDPVGEYPIMVIPVRQSSTKLATKEMPLVANF